MKEEVSYLSSSSSGTTGANTTDKNVNLAFGLVPNLGPSGLSANEAKNVHENKSQRSITCHKN